ncbi:MAG: lipase family protein [Bacteroidota bacterium]
MKGPRKKAHGTGLSRRKFIGTTTTATLGSLVFSQAAFARTSTKPAMLTELSGTFDELLPPTASTISDLVKLYLEQADKPQFLMALAHHKKEVAVPYYEEAYYEERDFTKLAESMLLFDNMLTNGPDQAKAVRRLYQHYCVNTDGPIPLKAHEDAFNVFEWTQEYADLFSIKLEEVKEGDKVVETLMTIDDPDKPVRCAAWGRIKGWSGARSLRDVGQVMNHRRYGRDDVIPSMLFPFASDAVSYTKANAIWMSECSQLAYMREGYVRDMLTAPQWGFDAVHWIENRNTDTQGFVAVKDSHIVVSFRGTKEPRDFLTDLNLRKQPFLDDKRKGRVHVGFNRAFESIKNDLGAVLDSLEAEQAGRPIFVTGHSLGAAIAQLTACALAHEGRKVAAVYTYGAPRVGNDEFCDFYKSLLKDRTYLHINNTDIVTKIPTRWLGFRHTVMPAKQFDSGHALSGLAEIAEGVESMVANQELMEVAAAEIEQTLAHLEIDDLTPDNELDRVSYSSSGFDEGAVSDHGISQYLFKFACSIVDDKLGALG